MTNNRFDDVLSSARPENKEIVIHPYWNENGEVNETPLVQTNLLLPMGLSLSPEAGETINAGTLAQIIDTVVEQVNLVATATGFAVGDAALMVRTYLRSESKRAAWSVTKYNNALAQALTELADRFNVSIKTLQNRVATCSHWKIEDRVDGASYKAHEACASLDIDACKAILEQSVESGLTLRQTYAMIQTHVRGVTDTPQQLTQTSTPLHSEFDPLDDYKTEDSGDDDIEDFDESFSDTIPAVTTLVTIHTDGTSDVLYSVQSITLSDGHSSWRISLDPITHSPVVSRSK